MGSFGKLSIYHCTDLKPFNQIYIQSPAPPTGFKLVSQITAELNSFLKRFKMEMNCSKDEEYDKISVLHIDTNTQTCFLFRKNIYRNYLWDKNPSF